MKQNTKHQQTSKHPAKIQQKIKQNTNKTPETVIKTQENQEKHQTTKNRTKHKKKKLMYILTKKNTHKKKKKKTTFCKPLLISTLFAAWQRLRFAAQTELCRLDVSRWPPQAADVPVRLRFSSRWVPLVGFANFW